MSEQVTIERLFEDKMESKFKKGQVNDKTTIYTVEHPGVRMSGWGKTDWKPGDVVEIEITTKGNFTNFKPVRAVTRGTTGGDLEGRVKKLEDKVFGAEEAVKEEKDESGIDW